MVGVRVYVNQSCFRGGERRAHRGDEGVELVDGGVRDAEAVHGDAVVVTSRGGEGEGERGLGVALIE